jgi:hypothetical protein
MYMMMMLISKCIINYAPPGTRIQDTLAHAL